MAKEKTPKKESEANKAQEKNEDTIDSQTHRRLLRFLNAARSPRDLAFVPLNEFPLTEPEPVLRRPEVEEQQVEREKLLEFAQARTILEARNQLSPLLGLRHIEQLRDLIAQLGVEKFLDRLIACMGPANFGQWTQIGQIETDDAFR
jgi:hypothetical protein